MLSSMQSLMFGMFVLTIVLVLIAEFATNIRFKRVMALASIATVTAAIGALVRDPPKGGDWPLMTWELQGKPAKKKQTRTAYVRTGDEDEPDQVNYVVEEKKTAFAEEDTASERLERLFVTAFKAPRDLGPSAGDKVRDCEACPELVLVPAGTSRVGADLDDAFATHAERPQAIVRIWPGFFMSRNEVSAAEYRAFSTATGRTERRCEVVGDMHAGAEATCVSPDDALAYVAWLRRITGKSYRLPSAAEWEYAARAEQSGEAGRLTFGANMTRVSRAVHAATGDVHPWGLQGMGSGVAELTADCWSDDLRLLPTNGEAFAPSSRCPLHVLKDGAATDLEAWRRPSARQPIDHAAFSARTGFRVVRSIK